MYLILNTSYKNVGIVIHECGVTSDIRPARADEKRVNAIARKHEVSTF